MMKCQLHVRLILLCLSRRWRTSRGRDKYLKLVSVIRCQEGGTLQNNQSHNLKTVRHERKEVQARSKNVKRAQVISIQQDLFAGVLLIF